MKRLTRKQLLERWYADEGIERRNLIMRCLQKISPWKLGFYWENWFLLWFKGDYVWFKDEFEKYHIKGYWFFILWFEWINFNKL